MGGQTTLAEVASVIEKPDDKGGSFPLPILTDRPETSPGLGFQNIVDAIVGIVRDNHAEGNCFTIGVFGPWGSGKSSVLNGAQERLAARDDLVVTRFEAWRYADGKTLTVQLLRQMLMTDKMRRLLGEGTPLRRAGDFLTSGIGMAVSVVAALSGGDGQGVSKPFIDFMHTKAPDLEMSDLDLNNLFDEMGAQLDKKGKTAVVLVDDLDRCSPADIAQIIGVLNTLMEKRRFIFILALDRSYLVQAVTQAYALQDGSGNASMAFGERFLEKIIQVPLHVPRINFASVSLEGFVGEKVMKTLRTCYRIDEEKRESIQETIIPLGLNSNPRQVKRFLNDYLIGYYVNRGEINHLINTEEVDPDEFVSSMLYMTALRTASPAVYQRVIDAVRALREREAMGDEVGESFSDIISAILESEDATVAQVLRDEPLLSLFLGRLVRLDLAIDMVIRALEFSQVSDGGSLGFAGEWHTAIQRLLADKNKRRLYDDAVEFLNDLLRDQKGQRYKNEYDIVDHHTGNRSPTARRYLVRSADGSETPFCTLTFMTPNDELRFKLNVGSELASEIAGRVKGTGAKVETSENRPTWGVGQPEHLHGRQPVVQRARGGKGDRSRAL